MTISKQEDTSIDSHVSAHACNNAVPTSPTNNSGRSHASNNQIPVRFFGSKSGHLSDEGSPPAPHQLKVPVGDGPYVRAKQVQLVARDPDRAIALFWAAINAGDRVDSALKDMAVVMKQQNRGEEAIQAILSFRHLCSPLAQESLDNVLLDLYKKCGRLDDQIELLKHKLNLIHQGMVFNGKRTKTARSQGKKFQISIREEATRLLGNLGWSYMQLCNYVAAEAVYRKALSIDADSNKLCNLGVCLLKQCKYEEARVVLEQVTSMSPPSQRPHSPSHMKSFERSQALLRELRAAQSKSHIDNIDLDQESTVHNIEPGLITPKEFDMWTHWKLWEPPSAQISAPDCVEISANPTPFNTNPALNHLSTINTNDPALPKSVRKSKKIAGSYETSDMHPKMIDFACNYTDDIVTSTMSPRIPGNTGSFKREIGPMSTVQQSKAKKNTHAIDSSSSGICNCATGNHIDECWLYNGGMMPPALNGHKPVARKLLLDGSKQGAQSEVKDIANVCMFGDIDVDELMRASSSCTGAVDEDFDPQLCAMDTSLASKLEEDVINAATLDFTCVDRVIESIVPDAPSASQDMERNVNSTAHALDNAIYHDLDQLFAHTSEAVHVQHVESVESLSDVVHQYRLRIFQESTHATQAACALDM